MDSEIIGSIHKIYSDFYIPSNLQLHMFRVASVREMICDNWIGPKICKEDVIAVLLLHDLGNLVKFDFSSTELFFAEYKEQVEYLKQKQKEFFQKYGTDANQATIEMCKELGINARLNLLLERQGRLLKYYNLILDGDDQELKVISYADNRVSPFGIVSVEERFDDLIRRRKGQAIEKIYAKLRPKVLELEDKLFANITIKPDQINDKTIAPYLLKYKVKLTIK